MDMFGICSFILSLICVFSLKKYELQEEKYTYESELSVRGVLVILVVFNHAFQDAYLLGNIAVSLFFCFSGYGLIKSYQKKGQSYFINGYWRKKVENLVIPYCILNIIYIIWDTFIDRKSYSINEIIFSFFNATIMKVGWYTVVILILYFFIYFIYHILKVKENKKIFILFGTEFMLIFFLFVIGCGSWWYCSILAFTVGIAVGGNLFGIKRFINKVGTMCILVIFIILYIITIRIGLYDGVIFLLIKMWISVAICYIYYGIFKQVWIKNSFLKLLGKNSFLVYLIHPMFARIWDYIGFDSNRNLIFIVSQILFSLLFSISYYKIVDKIKEKSNDTVKGRL